MIIVARSSLKVHTVPEGSPLAPPSAYHFSEELAYVAKGNDLTAGAEGARPNCADL